MSIQPDRLQSARPHRRFATALTLTMAAAGLFFTASMAEAAIPYGNFPGDTVTYFDVEEGNNGLFEEPIISGDTLVFTPLDFEAFSGNGVNPSIVDGTVSFVMDAQDGEWIDSLSIAEAGAYTLDGVGTAATKVKVGVILTISVLEVDGVATIIDPLVVNAELAAFDLSDGIVFGGGWTGNATFDFSEILSQQANINGNITRAIVSLDNQLLAMSENGSVAFIDKKAINISTVHAPEPGTLALAALGSTMVLYGRFRRRA